MTQHFSLEVSVESGLAPLEPQATQHEQLELQATPQHQQELTLHDPLTWVLVGSLATMGAALAWVGRKRSR